MAEEEAEEFSAEDLDENVPLDDALPEPSAPTNVDKTPAAKIAEANAEIKAEHAKQARQNTLWRRLLFYSTSVIVVLLAIANIGFIVWYLINQETPNPVVLSTWVAGGATQVIGLLLVITRHLFPDGSTK